MSLNARHCSGVRSGGRLVLRLGRYCPVRQLGRKALHSDQSNYYSDVASGEAGPCTPLQTSHAVAGSQSQQPTNSCLLQCPVVLSGRPQWPRTTKSIIEQHVICRGNHNAGDDAERNQQPPPGVIVRHCMLAVTWFAALPQRLWTAKRGTGPFSAFQRPAVEVWVDSPRQKNPAWRRETFCHLHSGNCWFGKTKRLTIS